MANYPQLDDARGVWKLHEVYDAVMGGYWPNVGNRMASLGGQDPSDTNVIDYAAMAVDGNFSDFVEHFHHNMDV